MAVHIIAMHVIAIDAHHWHILGADCGSKTQWKLLSLLYQWARGGVKWNIGHRRLEMGKAFPHFWLHQRMHSHQNV